ncbi:hypothetical protein [Listeria grayi]|uniref:hypothetical protein n=1 Tax=Listeria grayi TaxID=1641 RepID=UPI001628E5F0|nr:hypothetical protein [Listeria grayi]MBC1922978.1 hypothetical protein [Listeria grayi]
MMFPYWKITICVEQPSRPVKKVISKENLTRSEAKKWMRKEAKRIEREWIEDETTYRHQIMLEDRRISVLYREKKTEEKRFLFRVAMERISIWEILNFK